MDSWIFYASNDNSVLLCLLCCSGYFSCGHWELFWVGSFVLWRTPFLLFLNLFFDWRIIALQNFVVFCQTSTWISHRYTYISSLRNIPPISLPIPPLQVGTESLFEFPEPYSKLPLAIFHMVMKVSMLLFPYISPSPHLSPGPEVIIQSEGGQKQKEKHCILM